VLLLLVMQAVVVMSLLPAERTATSRSGRLHLATAVILIVLGVAHVALNEQSKGERNEEDNRRVADLFGSFTAFATNRRDFSGAWILNPEKSQNIGMMSEMKRTQTIVQSSTSLDVTSDTTLQGNSQQTKTHYDLTGKTVTNDSPMAGPSETVSRWDGDKLVTTWTSQGAVADTTMVRTETLSLSPDKRSMTMKLVRGSNSAVVMVFDKK